MFSDNFKQAFIFLCLIFPLYCYSQSPTAFQYEVAEWMESAELEHSNIGICFKDALTDEILAETSPQHSLAPGSILKLATTATALEKLGPNFRFETQLAYSGQIRNDSLVGDLIIIGGGDPALGSKYFKEFYQSPHFLDKWLQKLVELNITHVTGNIISDVSIYEKQTIPNTWIWEDLGNYYGAGVFAISVYDNLYKIHLFSPAIEDQPTSILKIEPEIPDIQFENNVLSSNINRDEAYVFGSPLDTKRILRGTIPKGKSDFKIKASIPNPPYLLAYQLQNKLNESGITVGGFIDILYAKPQVTSYQVIDKISSPPLIDIIRVTNHESVNLFAEHLLKHMSFLETGVGSTKEGVKIVEQFWENKGLDMKGFFMADGSGLSHFNAVTAKQLVDILYYMKNESQYGELFFSSIPDVPNGTLYVFDHKNFPKGTLLAKSGSMTRVRCYAGSIITISGKQLLFTVMLNNFACSQAIAIDLIEELLVKARLSN
ncbi:D-alanyl-D-alanine carboxypeptidase/D-alanyl-D-alanine endopeptidase [Sunxiuqinia sp. A32]|uniref:D-alanyl-D-alanine carboxypeptidase/D-alanyl-D-alanine endopeptidase n=1 Tax=Sunxiuqinia sp. A32 TaxID=3461496 RepID=UPI0040452CBF